MHLRSFLLVAAQFLCFGYLLLTGPLVTGDSLFLLLEISGLGVGAWGIWAMGLGNLTVFPPPRWDHPFVKHGPYRFVRTPMYLAVLLVSGPLVVDSYTAATGAVWLALLLTIILKILYEEQLLEARFNEYEAYRRRTRRLLPYLY